MCECFKIGGPFIAEDPDCPIHGQSGILRIEEEQKRELLEAWSDLPSELRLDIRLDAVRSAIIKLCCH